MLYFFNMGRGIEMEPTKRRPFTVTLLYILHIFLGVGALAGGGSMVIDPSGDLIHMPTSMLERSPFSDFLIPGIFAIHRIWYPALVCVLWVDQETRIALGEYFESL